MPLLRCFNHLPHRDTFQQSCKQSRLKSDSFCKNGLIRVYYVSLLIYDHTLVNLTSNLYVLCSNMKLYLICNNSKQVELGMNMNVGEG